VFLKEQWAFMQSKALEILRRTRKEPGPLIVGFTLRNKSYHFLVKTSSGFHIFDNQNDFGQTGTKHAYSFLFTRSFFLPAIIGGAYEIADVVRKYDVLRRHCEAQGRPYDSILRSHLTIPLVLAETHEALQTKLESLPQGWLKMFGSSLIAGVPQEVISSYQALASAGVQYFICSLFRDDRETLRLLAEQIMPAVKAAKIMP
jgi:hypothetical protein